MSINTQNINQARKEIQVTKKNNLPVIVHAQDDEFNRKIFENKDVDIIFGLESHNRKDKLKQRDSGLNEFLVKLAKKNNIKIGIDIEKIKNTNKKDRAILLSRIIQNIELCKRTKTQIILYPEKYDKQETISFLNTLKR